MGQHTLWTLTRDAIFLHMIVVADFPATPNYFSFYNPEHVFVISLYISSQLVQLHSLGTIILSPSTFSFFLFYNCFRAVAHSQSPGGTLLVIFYLTIILLIP